MTSPHCVSRAVFMLVHDQPDPPLWVLSDVARQKEKLKMWLIFLNSAPKPWNTIPKDITEATSVSQLKRTSISVAFQLLFETAMFPCPRTSSLCCITCTDVSLCPLFSSTSFLSCFILLSYCILMRGAVCNLVCFFGDILFVLNFSCEVEPLAKSQQMTLFSNAVSGAPRCADHGIDE